MKLTKKHFEIIARAVKSQDYSLLMLLPKTAEQKIRELEAENTNKEDFLISLKNYLETTNPLFDKWAFIEAIY